MFVWVSNILFSSDLNMAGVAGFEPAHARIKT